MTEAQKEAHHRIHELMSEHFDAGVCILCVEGHDGVQSTDTIKVTHSGGCATAVGLCKFAEKWILYRDDLTPTP